MRPAVSVVIVAHRAGPALARCLDSLERQDAELEVVLVDNGALDGEVERAAARPIVRLVSPGRNLGFAGGANAGAAVAGGEILVLLNPDTVAADGAIRELAAVAHDPTVGVAMARLRLLEEPELLNSGGNVLHVTGLSWAGGYHEPAETASELRDVPFASGAAMAVRAATFRALGGFTEELFLYGEDLELAWRARLAGLRVVVVPRADVFHEYEFDRHAAKQYFLERNRLVFVLSAFSGRLLALAAPLLVAAEIGVTALAAKEGWLGAKVRGWGWCLRNARWLLRHRRETQALRCVPDAALAPYLTPRLDPRMVAVPRLVRAAQPLVSAYWRLARKAL
jgi:GT2 family glycosyltransferase